MCPVFTRMPGGVTVGDSGYCCYRALLLPFVFWFYRGAVGLILFWIQTQDCSECVMSHSWPNNSLSCSRRGYDSVSDLKMDSNFKVGLPAVWTPATVFPKSLEKIRIWSEYSFLCFVYYHEIFCLFVCFWRPGSTQNHYFLFRSPHQTNKQNWRMLYTKETDFYLWFDDVFFRPGVTVAAERTLHIK